MTLMLSHGSIITNRNDIMKLATNFYQNLYSSSGYANVTDLSCPGNTDAALPFLESEGELSIQKLNPGPDEVTNEMTSHKAIQPHSTKEKNARAVDGFRYSATLEKGDQLNEQFNVYKVFTLTLLRRISKLIDKIQAIEQAGFQKNYSYVDHNHAEADHRKIRGI
ncbi:Endonuclease-reverse transcriptase [Operophtera brumata]|uniref:Endonuclease-reverse transcriptase n=1 Tax=Operophtera brumata TaxID=104452 RepID=A0A0L7L6D3_OPEBR|nr:Endonuclease-reverse transcriptase [Operophtera brumata]